MSKFSSRGASDIESAIATHPLDLSQIPVGPPDQLGELETLAETGISDGWLAAIADRAATATMTADVKGLSGLFDLVRRLDAVLAARSEQSGARRALAAVGEMLGSLLDRASMDSAPFPAESERGRVLIAIAAGEGSSNEKLASATNLDYTQVSRAGRHLVSAGLAVPVRFGRLNSWSATPRGVAVVELLHAHPAPAMRRALDAMTVDDAPRRIAAKAASAASKSTRKEAPRKPAARRTTVRKTAAKKTTARKAAPRKTAAKKTTVRKTAAKKTTARKAAPRKTAAKKTTVRKTAAKKTTARKAAPRKAAAKKTTVRKTAAKKTTARKAAPRKAAAKKTTVRKTTARKAVPRKAAPRKRVRV